MGLDCGAGVVGVEVVPDQVERPVAQGKLVGAAQHAHGPGGEKGLLVVFCHLKRDVRPKGEGCVGAAAG